HIPDDRKAMSEIFRILKPGGIAILQVPQDLNRDETYEDPEITEPEDRKQHFGQYDHVRIYGLDYFDRLRTVGFKVEEVDYTRNYSNEEIDRYRLAKGEIIPVASK
ncbi:MAG: SAM-dependent methyltransferase, partial [Bacteroidia bacterium]|nr:SAM-dependent methyltransferase [Bacteroidia bacterium]